MAIGAEELKDCEAALGGTLRTMAGCRVREKLI